MSGVNPLNEIRTRVSEDSIWKCEMPREDTILSVSVSPENVRKGIEKSWSCDDLHIIQYKDSDDNIRYDISSYDKSFQENIVLARLTKEKKV